MPSLAALGDETRVRIVEALAERDRTVNEIVGLFSISQPAISRHLRLLREAGFVSVEAEGTRRIYRLDPAALDEVAAWALRWRATWARRFDALGEHLDRMAAEPPESHRRNLPDA
jgi:DNA-binding transcriptional ArsR family regulator